MTNMALLIGDFKMPMHVFICFERFCCGIKCHSRPEMAPEGKPDIVSFIPSVFPQLIKILCNWKTNAIKYLCGCCHGQ